MIDTFFCRFCREHIKLSENFAPGKCRSCRNKESYIDIIIKDLWKLPIEELNKIAEVALEKSKGEIVLDIPDNIKVFKTDYKNHVTSYMPDYLYFQRNNYK